MAENVKKTRTTAAKPRKAATKKANGAGSDPANHHAQPQDRSVSHDEIARLAHSYWQERGGRHGNHVEDWFRAEQELRSRAS